MRFAFGLVFGVSHPLSNILLQESSDPQHRGKVSTILNIIITLGKITLIIIASFIFKNPFEGVYFLINFLG